jgi:hypothetical protein
MMEFCCVCVGAPCRDLGATGAPHHYCERHQPAAPMRTRPPVRSEQQRAGMRVRPQAAAGTSRIRQARG